MYIDGSGVVQTIPAPGHSITIPFNVNAPAADSYPGSQYVTFCLTLPPSVFISELFNAFKQWQPRACRFQFENLTMAGGYGASAIPSASPLVNPEVLFVTDSTTQSPIATPSDFLTYVDVRQKVLDTRGVPLTVVTNLRPQQVLQTGIVGVQTAALSDNIRSMWFYTQTDSTFVGPQWCIRNWFSTGGVVSPGVRISIDLKCAFRTPF